MLGFPGFIFSIWVSRVFKSRVSRGVLRSSEFVDHGFHEGSASGGLYERATNVDVGI